MPSVIKIMMFRQSLQDGKSSPLRSKDKAIGVVPLGLISPNLLRISSKLLFLKGTSNLVSLHSWPDK